MSRKKAIRMVEVLTFKNVFRESGNVKNQWSDFFENENPIILEVGCGHGEYVLKLAEMNPDKNYIGVEMKGGRIWSGAKKAIEHNLKNVAFINNMMKRLPEFFEQKSIAEIWVTFPDPHHTPCKAMQRLISPRHLEIYKRLLRENGVLHFKTDCTPLFDYGLEVLVADKNFEIEVSSKDLYADEKDLVEAKAVQTFYEKKFMALGENIKYLKAKFKSLSVEE